MATADVSTNRPEDKVKLRDEWLARLSDLVETVRGWAEELDWSTRRIEAKMEDSEIGTYKAPALILQRETVRAILEPIGRAAPADGYRRFLYHAGLRRYRAALLLRRSVALASHVSPNAGCGSRTPGPAALQGDVPVRPRSDDPKCRMNLHGWIRRIRSSNSTIRRRGSPSTGCWIEARRDPTIFGSDLKLHDIVNASGRLEGTYIIRLFAEFETGLRLFWATIRETEPPTQHLLDGIAARRESRLIASRTPMRCESIGTPWCMSGTKEWPRSRSRRPGDICAATSRSCRQPGDPTGHVRPCLASPAAPVARRPRASSGRDQVGEPASGREKPAGNQKKGDLGRGRLDLGHPRLALPDPIGQSLLREVVILAQPAPSDAAADHQPGLDDLPLFLGQLQEVGGVPDSSAKTSGLFASNQSYAITPCLRSLSTVSS